MTPALMQFFWNVLTNAGPLACLVAFHAWQSHKREERFEGKVAHLQEFQTETLVKMVEGNAGTVTRNTHALKRNAEALNRLEFVATDGDGINERERMAAKSTPPKRKRAPAKSTKAPKRPPQPKGQGGYEARKERERARQRRMSEQGRDIAPIPKVRRPAVRRRCEESFKYFCLRCFPAKFTKDFSPDHLLAIDKIEKSSVDGLLFALAMPRGSGKTTIVVAAVLWAILCGHRRYVALIGPTSAHAKKMLRTIKVELQFNDELLDLFPEACWAFRSLGGIANRARGQLHNETPTGIEWGKELIVFATLPNAASSGAVIETAGLTGSVRGMQYAAQDGDTRRPDLVVIDDPQTKRSAKSETQCADRLETIQGDVLGLAGPGEAIAGFVLCTVIRKGDVADQLLDREAHPEWGGERYRLIYSWPTAEDLWDQYAQIRAEELQAGRDIAKATAFYRQRRKKMDVGHRVAWEARKEKTELSALQHVYNLLLRDPEAFYCEYQNEPKDPGEDTELLTVDEIAAKVHGYGRGVVPPEVDTLTSFIDVQGKALYWMVCGWRSSDFTGWVLDWGTWPDQGLQHFTLAGIRRTLAKAYPRAGLEGRVRAGLVDLITHLSERVFKTPTGTEHRIRRIGADAAWGDTSKVVQAVCREHDRAVLLYPCFGRGIKPSGAQIEQWPAKPGERRGMKLIIRPSVGGGRHLLSDTNFYKSFIHRRFATALGDPGSLSMPKVPKRHRLQNKMVAEQCRAEIRAHVKTEHRSGDVWTEQSHKPDNHFFDTLANCATMAAAEGVMLAEHRPTKPKPKKRKKRSRVSPLAA